MIHIEKVSKKFGDFTVLENINLNVNKGDIHGLVGKSGAGKSTLLRCINGLESFGTGEILVDSRRIKGLSKIELREYRKSISMIFQHFALLSRKSVYENIAFPMKCWGYDNNEIDLKVKNLSQLVGIQEKLNERVTNLSGGQKQRVAIARALSTNPKVLLCDEATSALDPVTTKAILNLLKDINNKLGITIVVVTHQMEVIKSICKKISLLDNGRIILTDLAEDLFIKQPDSFKDFLGKIHLEVPSNGSTLRLAYVKSEDNCLILSKIINKLKIDISVISTETSLYREKQLSEMVINFDKKYLNEVIRILSDSGVYWEELIRSS